MKLLVFVLMLFASSLFGQKNDLISCNVQLTLQEDSTAQVWTLANSFTTDWNNALELQPSRTSQDLWQSTVWVANNLNPPQSTNTLYFYHMATQTRTNEFEGLVQVRDKVCVYLFEKRVKSPKKPK